MLYLRLQQMDNRITIHLSADTTNWARGRAHGLEHMQASATRCRALQHAP